MILTIAGGGVLLLVLIGGLVYYFAIYRPRHAETGSYMYGGVSSIGSSFAGMTASNVTGPTSGGRVMMSSGGFQRV